MSTYRASVRVTDGMLHTSRPLFTPDAVTEVIDSVLYDVAQPERAGQIAHVMIVVESVEDSQTPVGDGIEVERDEPLNGRHEAADDVDPVDGTPYLTDPASVVEDLDVTPSGRRVDDDPAGVPTVTAPVPGSVA